MMGRVAGVQTPAFVERLSSMGLSWSCVGVSPGFRLRPSLSGGRHGSGPGPGHVSPGFRLRPSLSVRPARRGSIGGAGVAGVQTPAFVERGSSARWWWRPSCVAGVQTPAFVERTRTCGRSCASPGRVAGVQTPAFVERGRVRRDPGAHLAVSPGFRLRPSLSGPASCWLVPALDACRRGSDSGLR